jgi:serine/threonine protein kinase
MAKSINYLHNLNPSILHRDIKSMNFLLNYSGSLDHKYCVKVCDFGLAEIRHETLSQSASFPSLQLVGSFYWKAPELLTNHGRHTKQSDIYSLGMVFWELATARKPWDEYEDEEIILIQIKTGERPTIPSDIPEQFKQLIQDAWNHNPQKRPTCFQLMERIHKEINSKNQSPIPVNEENVIDLHPQQITTEQYNSIASTICTESGYLTT